MDELENRLEEADAIVKGASHMLSQAEADRDQIIREAATKGLTRRKIAAHAGISHQRVHQILERD